MALIGRPSAACSTRALSDAPPPAPPNFTGSFAANDFFNRSDAARFAERANVVIRSGSAEKLELFAVELDALGAHDLLEDQSAGARKIRSLRLENTRNMEVFPCSLYSSDVLNGTQ